ncbi:putative nucleic acid-binding Zn ribbon protein [Mumia flava]|uniref:Putative nucleic acid-binding Zn ribbon protein n=1 Tax=Mumia flava TaxID=1348852 RepID=A0A0B2B2H7_9ACTN|nr:DciA family protein [Mumia flava]PJJ57644.1 putative nucleic acid-binding Zn ribbon protein [Mumia flava]
MGEPTPDGPPDQDRPGTAGEQGAAGEQGETSGDGLDLARSIARRYRTVGPESTGRGAAAGGSSAGGAGASRRRRRRSAPQSSGAGPDDRDPQLLAATLGRLVDERGWETEVAVHGVFGRWTQIVGAEIAAHCRPVRYADAELWVVADSTAWATQLRMLAPRLVARLNEQLGDGTVVRINVRGPQAPSWTKGGRSVRGRGPRDTYG